MSGENQISERLLTFEVEGALYALPIRGVLEVAESSRVTSVPTLSLKRCGVMNWHGDALPVISAEVLLAGVEVGDDAPDAPGEGGERGEEMTPGEAVEPLPARAAAVEAESLSGRSPLARKQVLVVTDRNEAARLGLPIDSVQGIVDGVARRARAGDLVLERRSIDGRVVSVLDPRGLVGRAESVIQQMVA